MDAFKRSGKPLDNDDSELAAAFRRDYPQERTELAVSSTACPACGRPPGVRCRTVIDGTDTGWTHDARVFAHMGVRG